MGGFAHECVPAAELDAVVDKLCERLAQAGPEAREGIRSFLEKCKPSWQWLR